MAAEGLYALIVLLLPVAAWSGWYYARRDHRSGSFPADPNTGIPRDYFKGLNYLLNDRPDKAMEVFVKVLEVENETVETHLALGNLFRRRGEVDRAIRIHQNLVAKPTLDVDQRALALLELGLDYMRSGLLDRAESLFKELLEMGMYEPQALRHVVDIYQQEQDWDAALEYNARLERVTGENLSPVRAHFYCEKARARLDDGAFDEAMDILNRSIKEDRKCVRASLMSAEISFKRKHYGRAIDSLKKIEHQDIDFLPEAIGPLVASYRALDQLQDLSEYLIRLSALHAGITPVLVLAELAAERDGYGEAKRYIVGELKMRPTIRGIDRLIEYLLKTADGDARENLALLKETTGRLIADKLAYKCGNCGFTARSLHWQCPSCKFWNTVKPIHGIEGE
jgi:lipopolysaccharide biosynthesis regulator YciM